MAHVKCNFDKWICGSSDMRASKDCFHCDLGDMLSMNDQMENGNCPELEIRHCFIEKTTKNVEFDGECLYINGKYICAIDAIDYVNIDAGDTCICFLEIDGEQYIPEPEEQKTE